jgi:hypothetical protein
VGFSKICIQGAPHIKGGCAIVPENTLVSEVAFARELYDGLLEGDVQGIERHEFFIGMIIRGVSSCPQLQSVTDEIDDAVDEFRRRGYKNEWRYTLKRLGNPYPADLSLVCSLTSERFTLTLVVGGDDRPTTERVILTTMPDEIIYSHKFRSIDMEDQEIVVRDKFGEVFFHAPLGDFE